MHKTMLYFCVHLYIYIHIYSILMVNNVTCIPDNHLGNYACLFVCVLLFVCIFWYSLHGIVQFTYKLAYQ